MSNKHRQQKAKGGKGQARPAKAEVLPSLDTSILDAAAVKVRDFESVQIIQAGGGGNGSFMALHVGRIMSVLNEMGIRAHWTLADPDSVKEENRGRTNFCDADVGKPKAQILTKRYGHAWGLSCDFLVGDYDESLIAGLDLTVLVGCVDGPEGRRALHQTLMHNERATHDGLPTVWWLDLGNLRHTGRVLLGSAFGYDGLRGCFTSKTECAALPSPALQHRGLLKDESDHLPRDGMSCAERVAANVQSMNINAVMAARASEFLTQLLITKTLKRYAFEENLEVGTTRPLFTTPTEIARVIGKPEGFVKGY